ncbi:MAG: hypothetical protein Q7S40_09795 [Opitutaceae bacterium]|nr:hypothetical protein [Opitutaceae bacterium]
MKTKLLLIASAFFAAWSVQAAERVDTSQLPAPLKNALNVSAANEAVKEVTIRNVGGQTVYDVELERDNAPNARLRISADGTVLRDSRRAAVGSTTPDVPVYSSEYGTAPYVPKLKLEELPAAARQAINQETAGREIGDITSDTVDGRAAYRVEFRERGRNPRFYVAEDGTLLRPTEKPPALGLGTTFSATPAAVQQTIRREAADGEIVKIDKEGLRGAATIYKVEIKNSQGSFQLELSESGSVLRDSRRAGNR